MEEFFKFFNSQDAVDMMPNIRKRIVCPDGFSISVQASSFHYCSPRENNMEWYNEVECGYPSTEDISDDLKRYAETGGNFTTTVYGFVPIDIVIKELNRHGFNF